MGRYWYQENLRILQTVLREPDIIDYDAKAVVKYMKDNHYTCLNVNAGGVIDFFDNPLPMKNPNRFMQFDYLRPLCDEIHKAGLHIIVRVDFRGVEKKRYWLHPDWFSLDQEGNPRAHNNKNVTIYRPCYQSPYIKQNAQSVIEHIMSTYDVDGIWQNHLGFDGGPCYCARCRAQYKQDTGKEIPHLPGGPKDLASLRLPLFDEYREWKAKQADMHIENMRAAVKKHGEEKVYCAEIFDLFNSNFCLETGISQLNAKKSFDFMITCIYISTSNYRDRTLMYDYLQVPATTIRFARAIAPEKQPLICTGGNGTRWRYIADPTLETRLWMWEIASVGGGIWNCYFNGQTPALTHDRRNAGYEEPVYRYLAKNTDVLSNSIPAMDVGIYYSRKSCEQLRAVNDKKDMYGVMTKGVERVLLENHIQYSFIPDSELSLESLKRIKALLLPNAAYLSDKEISIIRAYVEQGGGLIASYETSLYDESGNKRTDFGLSDLFGVHYTGMNMDTFDETYQLIREKDSPLFNGIGDTDLIMNDGRTLLCISSDSKEHQVLTTHVPQIPGQPPEYAWIPSIETESPVIVSGTYGKGKVVYFANYADAQCYLNGHSDFTEIYKNAVDYVSGKNYLLNSNAPRSVHVNVVEQQEDKKHLIVALVNTGGTAQRPIKEILPAYHVEVKIPLNGLKLAYSNVLWGEGIAVGTENENAVIKIERLDEFASVELKLQ